MQWKNWLFKSKKFAIGDTPLIRRKRLIELFSFPKLLVKDESRNPFGTFKDRRNELIIKKAMEARIDKLALITSGNSGYSLARLAEGTGIKVVCIVDRKIDPHIKEHLKKYAEKVIEVDLSQKIFRTEDIIDLARGTSVHEEVWDVTNDYHEAFHSIVGEIEGEDPDYLICPLGSGEAYVGLYEGLKKYRLKTKLIGVGVHELRDNELTLSGSPSIADKLYTPYTPYRRRIEEVILEEGHFYRHVSDEQIINTYEKIKRIISCEPSSAAAFAALPELDIDKNGKVIVINSGKGVWGI